MSVFSRPRSDADVLPSEYSYRLHTHKNCGGWERVHDACVGDAVASESRLLLADLGASHANLYAWPTTSEGGCWAFGAGSGSCFKDFDLPGGRADVMGLDPDAAKSGAPATVLGVVPDDVVAAAVVVDGVAHAVSVENNALFYELPDIAEFPCQLVDSVTVFYMDESSDTFGRHELSWGWRRSAVDIPGDDPCRLSS